MLFLMYGKIADLTESVHMHSESGRHIVQSIIDFLEQIGPAVIFIV